MMCYLIFIYCIYLSGKNEFGKIFFACLNKYSTNVCHAIDKVYFKSNKKKFDKIKCQKMKHVKIFVLGGML